MAEEGTVVQTATEVTPYVEGIPTKEEVASVTGESTETKITETPPVTKPEDGGKPPVTPQETKAMSQVEIDKIVQDRLARDRKNWQGELDTLRTENQKLKETTTTVQAPKAETIKHPDMVKDVGEYLEDPTYKGWSMAELKADQPEHYNVCLSRIYTKMDIDRRLESARRQTEEQQSRQKYQDRLKGQIAEVKKEMGDKAGDYFGSDGAPNQVFMTEYGQWGADQGILNPLLAYKIKGKKHFLTDEELDEKLTLARQEGAKGILKKAQETQPIRKVENKGETQPVPMDQMEDEDLMKFYGDSPQSHKGKEARKLLKQRGLI